MVALPIEQRGKFESQGKITQFSDSTISVSDIQTNTVPIGQKIEVKFYTDQQVPYTALQIQETGLVIYTGLNPDGFTVGFGAGKATFDKFTVFRSKYIEGDLLSTWEVTSQQLTEGFQTEVLDEFILGIELAQKGYSEGHSGFPTSIGFVCDKKFIEDLSKRPRNFNYRIIKEIDLNHTERALDRKGNIVMVNFRTEA